MRKLIWAAWVVFSATVFFTYPEPSRASDPGVDAQASSQSETVSVTESESVATAPAEEAPTEAAKPKSKFSKFLANKAADLVDLAAKPVSTAKGFAVAVQEIRSQRAEEEKARQAAMYQYIAERRKAISEGTATAISQEEARASIERIRVQVDSSELSPEKEAELAAAIERALEEIQAQESAAATAK